MAASRHGLCVHNGACVSGLSLPASQWPWRGIALEWFMRSFAGELRCCAADSMSLISDLKLSKS